MSLKNTALIIVDMQKDVLKKMVKTGHGVIPEIKTALIAARKHKMPVIFLVRVHRKSGIDVEIFRTRLFKESPFLVAGTTGAEMVDPLKPLVGEYIVEKKRFSGFFQSDLLMILMRLKVDSVAVCGVQTPNCIRATVTDALSYDFETTVLKDATAAQSPVIHEANLLDMNNQGAKITTVKEFFKQK